mgnify:CR=1 FL=1
MMLGADNGKLPLSEKYILVIHSYVYFHVRIWGHILRVTTQKGHIDSPDDIESIGLVYINVCKTH